jgi:F0F1-type ATP synthase assembly protein I
MNTLIIILIITAIAGAFYSIYRYANRKRDNNNNSGGSRIDRNDDNSSDGMKFKK